MGKFENEILIVIPVVKKKNHFKDCLDALVQQSVEKKQLKVLLLMEEKSDSENRKTAEIYAEKYPYINIVEKKNGNLDLFNKSVLSFNCTYFMPIDADFALAPNAVGKILEFWRLNDTDTDVVVYSRELTDEKQTGIELSSGIYEIDKRETAVHLCGELGICIKTECIKEISFCAIEDITSPKFYVSVLKDKKYIGVCNEVTNMASYREKSMDEIRQAAYYTFEKNMSFWERIFEEFSYENVPNYIQAMWLNEVNGKIALDMLFPYHYDPSALCNAKRRITRLMDCVEDSLILEHPQIDKFHKHYLIGLKSNANIKVEGCSETVVVSRGEQIILQENKIQIVLSQFKVENDRIKFLAYLKSPIFNYTEKPCLFLIKNKNQEKLEEVDVCLSACSYYKGKSLTNSFWQFTLEVEIADIDSFEFRVGVQNVILPCYYYFSERVCFNRNYKRFRYRKDHVEYRFRENVFYINKLSLKEIISSFKKRSASVNDENAKKFLGAFGKRIVTSKKEIWLYFDSRDVKWDNGYYQFTHDIEQKDRIQRYYVLNAEDYEAAKKEFPKKYWKRIIKFGSDIHKTLFLGASKVLIAFAGTNTYNPFDAKEYQKYLDVAKQPEIIYLQHGVLHAHMPWKYSYGRLRIDREVVSTQFEIDNLKKNYCFHDEALIPAGMPRYDFIDLDEKPMNRILFAPSWRKYLIDRADGEWIPTEEEFLNSKFYRETLAFLNSEKLGELLERYDYYLDFKLHPIFEAYKHLYKLNYKRVSVSESKVSEAEYKIFITDFSSYVFDFVYLERAIVYFIPDDEMFRAGMSGYREVDLPLDDAFGEFVKTSDAAVAAVEKIIMNDGMAELKYAEKMKNFFLYKDNGQRERIYQALIKK